MVDVRARPTGKNRQGEGKLPREQYSRNKTPSRNPAVQKPRSRNGSSTTGKEADAGSAGSTNGYVPGKNDGKPRNSGSAETAADRASLARHAAPPAPRPTGSPAGSNGPERP